MLNNDLHSIGGEREVYIISKIFKNHIKIIPTISSKYIPKTSFYTNKTELKKGDTVLVNRYIIHKPNEQPYISTVYYVLKNEKRKAKHSQHLKGDDEK